MTTEKTISKKSYTVAACLAGVFGILGIHHFYVGRWGMGLFDVALSIIGFGLIWGFNDPIGWIFIAVDVVHTAIVMYLLLVGEYKDGRGNIIAYPGQKL